MRLCQSRVIGQSTELGRLPITKNINTSRTHAFCRKLLRQRVLIVVTFLMSVKKLSSLKLRRSGARSPTDRQLPYLSDKWQLLLAPHASPAARRLLSSDTVTCVVLWTRVVWVTGRLMPRGTCCHSCSVFGWQLHALFASVEGAFCLTETAARSDIFRRRV